MTTLGTARAMQIPVFPRWRAVASGELVKGEVKRYYTQAQDPLLTKISITSNFKPSGSNTWSSGASFAHVFESTANNEEIFNKVVAPTLPHILAGSACNFFAYGHTGSGKTHTMIGQLDPVDCQGLYLFAARQLQMELENVNKTSREGVELVFAIRLFELRRSKIVDLLDERKECFAREGEDGRTHIRGQTETLENGRVRVKAVSQKICATLEDLVREMSAGLALRATGSSAVHNESSRTHAVLEIEVVSAELVAARNEVVERQSDFVPVAKHATDVYLEETMKSLIKDENGQWIQNPESPLDQKKIDDAEEKKKEFEGYIKAAEQRVQEALEKHKALGGKAVFVDLAGAEYQVPGTATPNVAKQTAQERRESRQINTDLLALKEVIRAWAADSKRIPFRSSTLTMVLRDYFLASASSASRMILTVSPAEEQYRATKNALQYGSLVGAAI